MSTTWNIDPRPFAHTVECASCPNVYAVQDEFLATDSGLCTECSDSAIALDHSLIRATRIIHADQPWLSWLAAFRRVVFLRVSQ